MGLDIIELFFKLIGHAFWRVLARKFGWKNLSDGSYEIIGFLITSFAVVLWIFVPIMYN